MNKPNGERRQRTVDAVAHFVALMHAYERGKLATAAVEEAALEQLGVRVRIVGEKGTNHAK